MVDEKGLDEKVLAVPVDDPRFAGIVELDQLQEHWAKEISSFFRTYKELQGAEVEVRAWHGAEMAWRVIVEARSRFAEQTHP
jgi:inorganic pyrophosphatase